MPPVQVHKLNTSNASVRALATTVVGPDSLDAIREAIVDGCPDVVVLDYDESRWKWLADEEFRAGANLVDIIRRKEMAVLNSRVAMGVLSKILNPPARDVRVDDEFKVAHAAATEQGIPVVFARRSVDVEGRRAWQKTPFLGRAGLAIRLFLASLRRSAAQKAPSIEEAREAFDVDAALHNAREKLGDPAARVILDESEAWSARELDKLSGDVVWVTTEAHVRGVERVLGDPGTEDISGVDPPSWFGVALPWLFSAAIIAVFILGFVFGDFEKMQTALLAWVISNCTLAAIGAALAGAHPWTIAATCISAPFVSLNPAVGAGMVGALVEAFVSPPSLRDIDYVGEDITEWRGWWRNGLSRLILIFIFANVFSTIGSFVALAWLP